MAKKAKRVTLHDRFVKALEARGCTKVPTCKGVKITIMQSDECLEGCYYVGKAGSLRIGVSKAKSIPVSPAMRNALLAEANTTA